MDLAEQPCGSPKLISNYNEGVHMSRNIMSVANNYERYSIFTC